MIRKIEFASLKRLSWLPAACIAALGLAACSKPTPAENEAATKAAHGPHVYVSNEVSGDISIMDASTFAVNTIHPGKRARGIHASPDGAKIYIALSSSPIAGPHVDESTLPPPDKSADAIAEFDVATRKVTRMLQAGSDPENFAVAPDGKTIYVSNEDDEGVSFLDIAPMASSSIPPTKPTAP